MCNKHHFSFVYCCCFILCMCIHIFVYTLIDDLFMCFVLFIHIFMYLFIEGEVHTEVNFFL